MILDANNRDQGLLKLERLRPKEIMLAKFGGDQLNDLNHLKRCFLILAKGISYE